MSFLYTKELADLINNLSVLTEIPFTMYDENFDMITGYMPADEKSFCSIMKQNPEFHKKCVQCDINACKKCKKTHNLTMYKCHIGLIEAVTPLFRNNVPIGYLMFGQLTDIKEKDKLYENILKECSAYTDEKTLKKLTKKIKYKSAEQIFAVAKMLDVYASYIQLKEMIRLPEAQLIAGVEQFIDEHMSENISVGRLCREFNISRTRLYDATTNHTNGGLAAFIKEKRLLAAATLLKTTDFSIGDISERVGFSDYNYFSRAFKKRYNMSPKEYRKRYKN